MPKPGVFDPVVLIEREAGPRRSGVRIRHLVYMVVYCALFLWVGVMTGFALVTGLLGVLFAIVFGSVYLYASRRSTQQDALLWGLAVTAERGMPLAPTFDVFAAQSRWFYRRKVVAAAQLLRQGLPLPQVLEREPRLFPRDAEILTRVGYACGRLGDALRESAALRARFRGPWTALALRISYLLWVLIVLEVFTSFTLTFIMPKYEAIFNDFGVPLPGITLAVIGISHFFIRYAYILAPFALLEIVVLVCAVVSAMGVLPWDLPLVASLFHRRHSAMLLRCLAYVVEANKPMTEVIRRLARTYPAEPVRNRLLWVVRDLEAGMDWCESLASRGLIRPAEASLLEAAKRVGNLAWALRQAAENTERRLSYRFQLWVHWFLPLFVLLAGATVFVTAIAYFTPLLVLIEKLSG